MKNYYNRIFLLFFLMIVWIVPTIQAQWVVTSNSTITSGGCGIATYNFVASVTNNGVPQSPSGLYYHWDFGNSTQNGSQPVINDYNVNRSYSSFSPTPAPGGGATYTVLLRVYSEPTPTFNPSLLLATQTFNVTIFTAPSPTFSANITDVCLGDMITFTDPTNYSLQQYVGSVVARTWNFGDGNISTISNPAQNTINYTYTIPGTYQVTLTTGTSGGRPGEVCAGSLQIPAYIRVRHKPVSSFSILTAPCTLPGAPTLSNTSTIPNSPTPAGVISSYVWRFYSGPSNASAQLPFSPISTTSATPPTLPANAYTSLGNYAITLEAISSTGCSNISTQLLTIATQVADFNTSTVAGCVGRNINLTNNSTAGASSFSWNFPGGTPSTSTSANPSVSFAASGTYNITLNVTYPNGCVRSITKPFVVTALPVANFTNSPVNGYCNIPKSVTFTPTTTSNANYSYYWNFGETNNAGINPGPEAFVHSPPANVYELFGNYNVTFTVTDNVTGCSNTITKILSITEPVMSIVPRPSYKGCAPFGVVFDISATAIETITRYSVDFDGDGTFDQTATGSPVSIPATATFTYTNSGTYIATFEIQTLNGCIKRVSAPLPIRVGRPPVITGITQTGGTNGCQSGGISFTPVFSGGFLADSIIYTYSDGSTAVTTNTAPYNNSHTFTNNGGQGITLQAFFNGCPIVVPYAFGVGINSAIPSIVVNGNANVCTGTNTICVNIGGTIASPLGLTNYVVNFGDGNTQSFTSTSGAVALSNICNTYALPGAYTITLTTTSPGPDVCTDTKTIPVTVSTGNPNATSFTALPTPSCSANQIQFTSTTSLSLAPGVNIVNYRWDFGDGSPISVLPAPTGANTTYTYVPRVTPYAPILTVVLSNGCSYPSPAGSVNIQGPLANIVTSPSLNVCVGSPVNFAGSASIIPNTNNIISWDWNFGDTSSGVNNTATSPNTSHIFNNAGTYIVTLDVRDNNSLQSGSPLSVGCINRRQVTVNVFPKPTVSFTINRPAVCVGSSVSFTSATNAGAGATYAWNFGDGMGTSTVANPVYAYSTPALGSSASRTVSLTVTNIAGCSQTFTQLFNVINPDFIITANGSVTQLTLSCPPATANFVSTVSPSNTDLTNWTFNWQFGDGNQANTQNAINQYNTPNAPGQFTVIFTATNTATGCSVVKTLSNFVIVNGPRGTFSFLPNKLCKPSVVTFNATGFTGNPTRIQWDFGDGSATVTDTVIGTSATKTHNYTVSGSFSPRIVLITTTPTCQVAYPSTIGRIDVSGVPNANFTWTGGGQICRNVNVNFSDLSTADTSTGISMLPNVNRWTWTIYDGTNGPVQAGADSPIIASFTTQNPSFVFTTAKTYLVRLAVRTAFNQGGVPDGCTAFIDKEIMIVDPTITATINPPTPLQRCPGEPITLSGTGNTTVTPKILVGTWRVYQNITPPLTNPDVTTPLIATIPATATAGMSAPDPWAMLGAYSFATPGYYTVELQVSDVALCTGGAVATQVVLVDPLPTYAPGSGPNNQSVCALQSATFTVAPSALSLVTPGVSYQWQVNDGGGWVNVVDGPSIGGSIYAGSLTGSFTITSTSTLLNNYQYRCNIKKANTTQCLSTSNSATLTVNQNPIIADAGPNQLTCNVTNITLAGNNVAPFSGKWTQVGGPVLTLGSIVNDILFNTQVNNLGIGIYTFRWTSSSGACSSNFDDVVITNSRTASVGATQNLCGQSSVSLTGNDPSLFGGSGVWSLTSGPAGVVPLISPTNNFTTSVTGLVPSTTPYVFTWTTSGPGCANNSSANVTINNNPLPSVINPSSQTICQGQTTTFVTSGSVALTYQWQADDNGGGGFVNIGNVAPYSGVTTQILTVTTPAISFNNYKYRVKVTNATTNCITFTNFGTLTIQATPSGTPSANPATVCQGTAVTIALSNTTNAYSYQLLVGATPVAGVPIITGNGAGQSFASFTPNATATYTVAVTTPIVNGSNCSLNLAPTLTVTVNPIPSASVAGTNQVVCATSATLAATPVASGTGTWSIFSGPGTITITTPSSPTSTVTGLVAGTPSVLRWTVTSGVGVGSCPPNVSNVTITRLSASLPSNAGVDQTLCAAAVAMQGSDPGTGIGTWTIVSGSGVFTNTNDRFTTVTGLGIGTNTFRWTVIDACGTTQDDVNVIREFGNTFADAGPNVIQCGATVTLSAVGTPAVASRSWTLAAGTSLVSGTLTSPTITVTGLALGANVFTWTVTNSCATSISNVTITRIDNTSASNAGIAQNICASTTTLNGNSPSIGTGTWSFVSGPVALTNANFSNVNQSNANVTGMTLVGTYRFQWTITNGACTPSSSFVDITRDALPSASVITAVPNICVDNTTISATNPAVGTGLWSVVSAPLGSNHTFVNAALNNTTINGLTVAGVYTIKWTVSNGTCPPAQSTTTITRMAVPTVSNAGMAQNICVNTATLNANSPIVGVGTWTVSPSAGVTFADVNLYNTTVSGLTTTGTYTFTWTITNAPCAASASNVVITRSANVGLITITPSATNVCGGNVNLVASALPGGATGLWTIVQGNGTFSPNNNPTTSVSGLSAGINTFRWTVTSGSCPAVSQDVTINSFTQPAAANAGPDVIVCGTTGSLNASTPTAGTGTWSYVGIPPGGLSFANINNPSTAVTGLPIGSHTLRWTVTNAPCSSSFDDVVVNMRGSVSLSIAGTSQTTCNSTWTLSANAVASGETGTWTFSGGNILPADIYNPNAPATLVMGSNIFTWTVNNGCATSVSTIVITRISGVTASVAGANQSICTNTTNLNGNIPSAGVGQWIVTSVPSPLTLASVTFVDSFLATTQVNGLTVAGNYILTWRIDNGTCGVSQSNVQITVAPQPSLSVITTLPSSICVSTTNLQAIAPAVGTGQWSVVSAPVGSLPTFANANSNNTSVSGLDVAGNYTFRWTVSNGSCTPNQTTITITREVAPSMANAGLNQTICINDATLSGNSPMVGIGTWSVSPAAGVGFGNVNQFNTSVTGLSTAGAYTFTWTISNGTCTPSTSTMVVNRLDSPSVAVITTAPSNTCNTTFALNAQTITSGTGLWSVVSSPIGSTVAFSNPTATLTNVNGLSVSGVYTFAWTVSNGSCPSTQATVSITRDASPSVANAGTNQTICVDNNINLSGNSPAVGIGSWSVVNVPFGANITFTNGTQGNAIASGFTFSGAYTLRWTITNGTCVASTSDIIITRLDNPSLAIINPTGSNICLNTITSLTAQAISSGTGLWSVVSSPSGATVTFGNPTNISTSVNGLSVAGGYTFKWTVSNGVCIPNETTVSVTRDASPSVANAGLDQTICINNATLSGNSPMVGNGTWSVSPSAGVVFGNVNQFNTSVTGLSTAGAYTFTWTINNGTCTPSTSTMVVNRLASPSLAIINPTGSNICLNTITSLTAQPISSGIGLWSVVSSPSGATVTFGSPTLPTTSVNGLSVAGGYTFKWTVSNGVCIPNETTVSVTRDASPSVANAGLDQTICINNATLSGNSPMVGNGTWSVSPAPGVVFGNVNQFNTSVTGLSTAGAYTFTWTISNGTCTPSTSTMVVNRLDSPGVAVITTVPSNTCNTTFALNAQTITSGTGLWSVVSSPIGSTVAFSNPTATLTNVNGLSVSGVYTFAWTVSNGSCPSTQATVSITRDASPSVASAGTNQTICVDNNINLSGNSPAVGIGSWSVVNVPFGANITFTNGTQGNAIASGFTFSGAYTLRWTITNGTCVASTSDIIITRLDNPSLAIINPTGSNICLNSITSLTAQAISSGIGLWSVVSSPSGATVTFGNPTSNSTSVNGLSVAGGYTFKWTVSNGVCIPNETTVSVTRDASPSIANAGLNQIICINDATLSGNSPMVGIGTWSVSPAPGVVFGNVNQFNTSVTGLSTAGAYTFTWTINNGTCTPSTSTMVVNRLDSPSVAVITTAPSNTCNTTFALNAQTITSGTGLWSVVSSPVGSTVAFSNPTNISTNVNGLSVSGVYTFAWTVSNGSCPSTQATVSITRDASPSVASAGTNQTICVDNNINLSGNSPAVGIGSWSVVNVPFGANITFTNGTQGNAIASGFTFSGAYTLRWTITNGTCVASTSDIIITRLDNPSLAIINPTGSNICLNSIASLTAQAISSGIGLWSVVSSPSGATVTFGNPTSNSTSVNGLSVAGGYTFKWTVSNGVCIPNETTVSVTRDSSPSVANAGSDQTICVNNVTLSGNSPMVGNGTWSVSPAPGVVFGNVNQFNTSVTGLSTAGAYTFTWTINNGTCTPSTSTMVVNRLASPSLAIINPTGSNICLNTITSLTAQPISSGIGLWSVVSSPSGATVTFGNPISNTTSVNGLSVAGGYTFKWTVSNGVCISNETTVSVTRDSSPSIANAGSDQTICVNNATLSGNSPMVGIGTWSVSPSAGVGFGNVNQFNTSVTGLSTAGAYTFTWTISNGTCTPSTSTMVVNRLDSPSVAVITTAPSNTCNTTFALNAQTITSGTGLWSVVSSPIGSTVAFSNPTATLTNVNGLSVSGVYTFAWTVSNGSCPSTQATVSITRDASPSVASAGTNQTICVDNNINLSGNSPAVGIGSWSVVNVPFGANITFTNGTQGNAIASGFTFSGAYTLRWTITNGTCVASTSDIIITRLDNPSLAIINPTGSNICLNSITSLTAQAISSGTGLWSVVSSPSGATVTFGNPISNTTSVNGLSVAGGYTFKWTVSNGVCIPNETTVSVTRDASPSVANAGSDQTICINNATLSGNSPMVGIGTWSVSPSAGVLFGNVNQFNTSVTGLSTATAYTFTWTISNGTCTPSTSTMVVNRLSSPSAAVINVTPANICLNSIASLTAQAITSGIGLWSVVSSPAGATVTFGNPTSNTTSVNGLSVAGGYTFKWTVSNGVCIPNETTVSVTRDASPSVANAGSDQTICINNATLSGNSPMVGVGTWSVSPAPGVVFGNVNQFNTSVTGLSTTGAYTFTWTISNGTCTPSTSTMVVNRLAAPSAAVITTAPSNTCNTTFALNAQAITSGTGLWSVVSSPAGSTVAFSNPTNISTNVNGLSVSGVYTFAWTVSNGSCPTTQATVSITRDASPSVANAGTNQTICINNTILSGNAPIIGVGTWSVSPSLGVVFGNVNQFNTSVTGLSTTGAYTFTWTISNGTCTASTSTMVVNRLSSPSAAVINATPSNICLNSIASLTAQAITSGTGLWSVVSSPIGSTVAFGNPINTSTNVTGMNIAGVYTFAWTVSNGVCTSNQTTVNVTRDASPSIANAGTNQIICVDNNVNLNSNIPSIGTGLWSVVNVPIGANITISNASQSNAVASGFTFAGTYTLRWTITNGTCNVVNGSASTSDVLITRLDSPSPSLVGIPQTVCTDATTLSATLPTIGTGTWSLVSGAGTILNPTSNNASVVSLGIGNNIFKWSVSNGICPPTENTLVVTRTAQPSVAIAGADQTICGNSTLIAGNLPTIGTGSWSVFNQPVGANATFANATQYNTTVSNLTLVGTYTLRWTIANGVCTSSTSDLVITKQQSPSPAIAGMNQQICNNSLVLAATAPVNGIGTWSVVSVPQGAVIAFNNANNPAATASGFSLIGNYVIKWTVANSICPANESTIVITRETGPSPSNAGQPQTICVDNTTLIANDPLLGTGAWSVVSGSGTFQNATSFITQVTNLGFGQNVFRWTITGTICAPTSSSVVITRLQLPTLSNAGTNQTLCAGTSTLNANTPVIGTGTWIVMSGGSVVANPNVPNATVTNLGVGANVFKWSITNGVCPPSESFVTITRDDNPSISNAGINQQVCAAVATLSANSPSVGIGTWTVVSGTGAINSINGNTTSVSNLAIGDNVFRWTIANGTCPPTTSIVTITRFVQPANADAGADKELCGASLVTMTAVPVTAGTGTWSQIEGPNTATFSNVNNPLATANGLVGGIYRFRWTVTNGVCITTNDDILVTNVPTPNTSTLLVVSDIAFCESQQPFINVTITNTQAGVLYEIRNAGVPLANGVSAGGLLTLTFPGTTFTTSPALQTIYNLEVYATPATLNNVQCPAVLLTDRARVTVNLCNNPITNPITRFTDFCTILEVDVMAVNNNDSANFNATVVTNFVTTNGGIVNILANGKVTYQPRTNFLGIDTFTYIICNKDTPQICNQGTITVNVIACTNSAPVAVDDIYNTDNCTVVTGNAKTNDSDRNNSPITVTPIAPFLTSKGGVFSMDATGAFVYTPKLGFVGADEITYQVCDDGSGTPVIKCTTAKIKINIAECNNVYIPDGFSPNGDGVNDLFVIVGADKFDIQLSIYDRWGNLIFRDEHYKNTWDGRVNVGIYNQNAEGVPNGTYFYVVDLRDGSKPRGRYLTIQR